MSIQLTCPTGHTLTVADAWAGRTGRCPVCKAVVQVPALPSPPSTPTLLPVSVVMPGASSRVGRVCPSTSSEQAERVEAYEAHGTIQLSSTPPSPKTAIAPLPEKTPSNAETSTGSHKPPPLPRPATDGADSLSKAAVDRVVAEIGGVQSYGKDGNAAKHELPAGNVVPPPLVASGNNTAPPVPIAAPKVTVPPHTGYQPDADKRWTVYYLSTAMAVLSLFCVAPAMAHWNLGSAPNWARAVLLLSLLQLAYGAWVASIPDWSTLRASMIVFTVVAALYGLTMTVALTTPLENALPLDLTDVRREAVLWCAGVVLLASLLAYFCGRAAWRWRRTLDLLNA